MPTYQYACTECAHAFEQVQSFSDDALTECPQCEGRLRKLFNAVGVVFKGSGFYRNDSRSTPAEGSSSGESSASKESSSKDSSSGESKKSESSSEKKSASTSEKKSETSTKSPQTAAS